jgi:putative phosphoribosyl transferase
MTPRDPDGVQVLAHGVPLAGVLSVPEGATGVVVFAHGSGSGRLSPRNQRLAGALRSHGLGTLLLDLLTADEERLDRVRRAYRFDIEWLADRVLGATHWLGMVGAPGLPIGYMGASTGAAAALVAAAREPYPVGAIVLRSGRPDLVGPVIEYVRAPTLLIAGEADEAVVARNRAAFEQLRVDEKALEIIPGAGHLFEEPGALDRVARRSAAWFTEHLAAAAHAPALASHP